MKKNKTKKLAEIRDKILTEVAKKRADELIEKAKNENKILLSRNDFSIFLEEIMEKGKKAIKQDAVNKAREDSESINKKAIKDVNKKMSDYLKNGSNGKYDPNQDFFPVGNGELKKMKKKARVNSKEEEEFIDDFKGGGLENLDYDVIKPNEEMITNYIEGSPLTGNSPKYGNAVETETNKKINKRRIKNAFSKEKKNSYKRIPQPVVNVESKENSDTLKDNKNEVIKEEIKKIKELYTYNKKTQ